MPVVPITQARIKPKGLPDVPPPSEPFALMAAAQMHAEGRLIKTGMDASQFHQSDNIEDRRNDPPMTADQQYDAERAKREYEADGPGDSGQYSGLGAKLGARELDQANIEAWMSRHGK